jgi:hypothetical protein
VVTETDLFQQTSVMMLDVKDVMTTSTSIPLATDVFKEFVQEMKLDKLMDPAELAQNTTNHPKMD